MLVPRHVYSARQALGTCRRGHYRTGRYGLLGMLSRNHVFTWSLVILGLMAPPARADLDLEACVGAWLEVRAWVNDLEVPESAGGSTDVPQASAVCIILRHRGRTVGVGRAYTSTQLTDGEALVHGAAMQAIEAAENDDVIAALPESIRLEAGTHLTIEMEIAGPPQALLGRTFQEATERLRPGVDGLAMRHGEQWWYHFPAHLRLTNAVVGPDRLYALALASHLSPRQIETLRTQGDVSLYRFSTIDLAQSQPVDPPVLLTAGDLAVVETDVTHSRLADARDALARHIMGRVFTTDDRTRLVGTFLPTTDGFDQKPPSDRDRYLVALSLARYSHTPGVDPALALEAEVAATRLLESPRPEKEPGSDMDPVTAAAWCLAADQLELADREVKRDTARAFVQDMVNADDERVRQNAHDLAFTASALSGRSRSDQQLANKAARRARDVLPIQQHLALLPWLGWIERENEAGDDDPLSVSDRSAMWLIREQVLGLQVPGSSVPEDAMESGGFRLQPGVRGVTAQSLRPAVFLSETLDDPAYADPERDEAIRQGHRRFLRYLLQLTCREDVAGTWRQPVRVLGGIRNATWDAKLQPVAQAMGLIVLSSSTSSP